MHIYIKIWNCNLHMVYPRHIVQQLSFIRHHCSFCWREGGGRSATIIRPDGNKNTGYNQITGNCFKSLTFSLGRSKFDKNTQRRCRFNSRPRVNAMGNYKNRDVRFKSACKILRYCQIIITEDGDGIM